MEPNARSGVVKPLVVPEIVTLPDEIDITNAEHVGEELRAAVSPGTVVIADMSQTVFCDSSAVRALLRASEHATACRAELRLVLPSATVLRALQILGFDRLLQIYPSLGMALTAGPPRHGDV
ncbi:MAG: STAS domain-containing protein [Streptosporangiaceae bacterium]